MNAHALSHMGRPVTCKNQDATFQIRVTASKRRRRGGRNPRKETETVASAVRMSRKGGAMLVVEHALVSGVNSHGAGC